MGFEYRSVGDKIQKIKVEDEVEKSDTKSLTEPLQNAIETLQDEQQSVDATFTYAYTLLRNRGITVSADTTVSDVAGLAINALQEELAEITKLKKEDREIATT